MPDELRLLVGFGLGFALTAAAVPAVIALARRFSFYDLPVGYKAHARPTPYLGGLAIVGGFVVAALAVADVRAEHLALIALALGLCVVGTLDDRVNLGPFLRLGIEVAAGGLLWWAGLGWEVFHGELWNLIVTVLWVVGLVNAFNLMDNLDGATGTVGAVAAAGAGALAAVEGDVALGVLAMGMAGACAGFLPSNLSRPSKIFMGDGGSMPVGFVVAATLVSVPFDGGAGWVVVLAALPLAGLPILDMTLVIISRRRCGVPILTGGRDHITHRLLARLGSPRAVALVLGVTQGVLCVTGVAVLQLEQAEMIGATAALLLLGAAALAALEQPVLAPRSSES